MSEYLFHLLTHESFKEPIPTAADAAAAAADDAVQTSSNHSHHGWWKVYEFESLPKSYDVLMDFIGKRYGAKNRMDQGKIFVHHFREGKLGKFTLDFIS
jgi:hypothetical protein